MQIESSQQALWFSLAENKLGDLERSIQMFYYTQDRKATGSSPTQCSAELQEPTFVQNSSHLWAQPWLKNTVIKIVLGKFSHWQWLLDSQVDDKNNKG